MFWDKGRHMELLGSLFWDKAAGVAAEAAAAFGMGVVPFAASTRLKDPNEMESSRRSLA
jgi:hypothetical protein